MRASYRRLIPLAFVIFIGLIATFAVTADSPADNACYDGGILEKQCQTDADWLCGWQYARTGSLPVGCAGYLVASVYPAGNARENACNTGGLMADKCQDDWAWTCGWYLAQWMNAGGWAGDYPLPASCRGLLSAEPSLPQYPAGQCVYNGVGAYYNFNGGWLVGVGTFPYDDAMCTTPSIAPISGFIVYAPAPYDPDFLCKTLFPDSMAAIIGGDTYRCM